MRSGGLLCAVAVVVVLAMGFGLEAVSGQGVVDGGLGSWKSGRATFYGNEPWVWSIHEGTCGYGYIWPMDPVGWDTVALADANADFAGSCGRCYEVSCDPTVFKDNFGNDIDRRQVCYDPSQSLVVRVTDACPCNFPENLYMNKRWCCGDMDHLDLSIWAFEKLANMRWGVIGIKYRPVPCTYTPPNVAPPPSNTFPGIPPPSGAIRPQGSQFPESTTSGLPANSGPGVALPLSLPVIGGPRQIFEGKVKDGWQDVSWFVQRANKDDDAANASTCMRILPSGGFAFQSMDAKFSGQVFLEFWAKTDKSVPDVRINLAGPKGVCHAVRMQDLQKSGNRSDGYSKFDVFLGLFDRREDHSPVMFSADFKGCGGNTAQEINQLMFRNDLPLQIQEVCLDSIQLVG